MNYRVHQFFVHQILIIRIINGINVFKWYFCDETTVGWSRKLNQETIWSHVAISHATSKGPMMIFFQNFLKKHYFLYIYKINENFTILKFLMFGIRRSLILLIVFINLPVHMAPTVKSISSKTTINFNAILNSFISKAIIAKL